MPELLITKDIASQLDLKSKLQVFGPDGKSLSYKDAQTFNVKRLK